MTQGEFGVSIWKNQKEDDLYSPPPQDYCRQSTGIRQVEIARRFCRMADVNVERGKMLILLMVWVVTASGKVYPPTVSSNDWHMQDLCQDGMKDFSSMITRGYELFSSCQYFGMAHATYIMKPGDMATKERMTTFSWFDEQMLIEIIEWFKNAATGINAASI